MSASFWKSNGIVLGCLISMATAERSDALIIKLTDAMDTGGPIVLDEGQSSELLIRLYTSGVDTINIAFVNAFLDVSGPAYTEVTALTPGAPVPPWTYDRSAFTLPAALSDPGGNEYGLVSGDQFGEGYPTGVATYIHDRLTLTQTQPGTGDLLVSFELGSRQPQIFGPSPTYAPYIVAPTGFPPGFPNFLYIGDFNGSNPSFVIRQGIPEPSLITLLAFSAVCLHRSNPIRRIHR